MTPEPKAIKRSIALLQADIVEHVEKIQGITTLESFQKNKVLRAIPEYSRIAIRSCHDMGKTFMASKIVLWAGSVFPGCKIITTAPTYNQVKRLLWSEIRAGHQNSKIPLGGVMLGTEWKIDHDWFAIGFTPRFEAGGDEAGQGTASSFQGFHAPYIIIVFDEATGIPKQIWDQAEGMMTSANVKLIAIGNPTSRNSEFYKCFTNAGWKKIHLSCFDSPNLQINGLTDKHALEEELNALRELGDEEQLKRLASYLVVQPVLLTATWVMQMALKWGVTHPLFLSKVYGEFPETSDDVLIPLGVVEAATYRTVTPGPRDLHAIGVDPARFGSDKTCLHYMHGYKVMNRVTMVHKKTTEITGRVIELVRSTKSKTGVIMVDATGIGSGVVDELREAQQVQALSSGWEVVEVHFGESPDAPAREHHDDMRTRYANKKAQMYNCLARDLRDNIDLPDESIYAEQLPTIQYSVNSKGKLVIESKDDYKKRTGLESPDEADSLALCNFARHKSFTAGRFGETDGDDEQTNRPLVGGLNAGLDY